MPMKFDNVRFDNVRLDICGKNKRIGIYTMQMY
jgi:hypothetical protein